MESNNFFNCKFFFFTSCTSIQTGSFQFNFPTDSYCLRNNFPFQNEAFTFNSFELLVGWASVIEIDVQHLPYKMVECLFFRMRKIYENRNERICSCYKSENEQSNSFRWKVNWTSTNSISQSGWYSALYIQPFQQDEIWDVLETI